MARVILWSMTSAVVNGHSQAHLEFSLERLPSVAAHESGLDTVRQQRSAYIAELRTGNLIFFYNL